MHSQGPPPDILKTFEGHEGIPGHRGGSLPKGVHHTQDLHFDTCFEAEQWAYDHWKNIKRINFSQVDNEKPYASDMPKVVQNGKHMDMRCVNEIMNSFNDLQQDYPDVFKELNYIYTHFNNKSDTNYATANFHKIAFNGNPFQDYDDITRSCRANESVGWWGIGCNNVGSIVDHEFGHTIERYMRFPPNPSVRYANSFTPIVLNRMSPVSADGSKYGRKSNADDPLIGRLSDTFMQFTKSNANTLAVSRYAKTNRDERFAEAFAVMRAGRPQPHQLVVGNDYYTSTTARLIDTEQHIDKYMTYPDRINRYIEWAIPYYNGNIQTYHEAPSLQLGNNMPDGSFGWEVRDYTTLSETIPTDFALNEHRKVLDPFVTMLQTEFGINKAGTYDYLWKLPDKLNREHYLGKYAGAWTK